MAYYEFLRASRSLLAFSLILAGLAAVIDIVTLFHSSHAIVRIDVGHEHHASNAPLLIFTSIAAWATAILATFLSTSLNRQREHLAYTWTRPQPRATMSLTFVAVDVIVLVLAFVVAILVEIACFEVIARGVLPINWSGAVGDVFRALGFSLMWYALIQAVTAGLGSRGGAVAGASWPVFIVAALLESARFPSPWQEVLTVINVFNPMAYLSSTTVEHDDVVLRSIIPFSTEVRLTLMYAITFAAVAVAVARWRRMEA